MIIPWNGWVAADVAAKRMTLYTAALKQDVDVLHSLRHIRAMVHPLCDSRAAHAQGWQATVAHRRGLVIPESAACRPSQAAPAARSLQALCGPARARRHAGREAQQHPSRPLRCGCRPAGRRAGHCSACWRGQAVLHALLQQVALALSKVTLVLASPLTCHSVHLAISIISQTRHPQMQQQLANAWWHVLQSELAYGAIVLTRKV